MSQHDLLNKFQDPDYIASIKALAECHIAMDKLHTKWTDIHTSHGLVSGTPVERGLYVDPGMRGRVQSIHTDISQLHYLFYSAHNEYTNYIHWQEALRVLETFEGEIRNMLDSMLAKVPAKMWPVLLTNQDDYHRPIVAEFLRRAQENNKPLSIAAENVPDGR